jgi:hypothetical protein
MRIANVRASITPPRPPSVHEHHITIPWDATRVVLHIGRLQGGYDVAIGVVTFDVIGFYEDGSTPDDSTPRE